MPGPISLGTFSIRKFSTVCHSQIPKFLRDHMLRELKFDGGFKYPARHSKFSSPERFNKNMRLPLVWSEESGSLILSRVPIEGELKPERVTEAQRKSSSWILGHSAEEKMMGKRTKQGGTRGKGNKSQRIKSLRGCCGRSGFSIIIRKTNRQRLFASEYGTRFIVELRVEDDYLILFLRLRAFESGKWLVECNPEIINEAEVKMEEKSECGVCMWSECGLRALPW